MKHRRFLDNGLKLFCVLTAAVFVTIVLSRCARLHHQAVRAGQRPQVREGSWPPEESRLQGLNCGSYSSAGAAPVMSPCLYNSIGSVTFFEPSNVKYSLLGHKGALLAKSHGGCPTTLRRPGILRTRWDFLSASDSCQHTVRLTLGAHNCSVTQSHLRGFAMYKGPQCEVRTQDAECE